MPKNTNAIDQAFADERERTRILAAIVQVNGGRLESKTILLKAYYLAHLIHWRDHNGALTADPQVVRLEHGPGVNDHRELLRAMSRLGLIAIEEQPCGEHTQMVFRTLKKVEVTEDEGDSILKALKFLRGATAKQASEITHKHSRSWNRADLGETLDIYVDAMIDEEFNRGQKLIDEARATIDDVFKQPG